MVPKYDQIGEGYNLTRTADPYISSRLYNLLTANDKGVYLDIGCGTGNYTIALHARGVELTGVDPSEAMLKAAKNRNDKIVWKKGTAENIPVENKSVDGVVGSLTIHHWANLSKGFSEIYRVLRENGKVVLFTSTPKQMHGYWLNYYFPEIMKKSIEQMPKLVLVKKYLMENNFKNMITEKYFVQPNLKDLFLYSGKHQPAFYLNKKIRQGISSFSDLANEGEIETGLIKLKKDIRTGKIIELIKSYENEMGDYLFVMAEK